MKKIKIGDNVKIIQGKEKGEVGKVKTIFHKKQTVIIDELNFKVKHLKPTQKDKVGKLVKFNAPVHISNVMVCNQQGIPSKIGFIIQNGKKFRILKKTKELIN
jgi:large subunit ribosomal protein L24